MFSRPEISGWKPAPSSSRAASRPATAISPFVGLRIPARSFSSVDLPEPFAPTIADGLARGDLERDVRQRRDRVVRGERSGAGAPRAPPT